MRSFRISTIEPVRGDARITFFQPRNTALNASRLPRREFLGSLASLAFAPGAARYAAAQPIDPIERPGPGSIRMSIAAYSYRSLLDFKVKKMDMFEFVTLAAKLGCDAVEPTSYWFPPDVDAAWLNRLKLHAFRCGLDISGTAIANDFCLPAGPKRDAEIQKAREWVEKAAVLGAPVIRIFGGSVPRGESEAEVVPRVIAAIEEVLPHAAEHGVSLALENHGGITSTPEQLLRLVRGVQAPHGNFGVNLDTYNFHGTDPYADVAQLAPYAINVQVKTEILPQGGSKQPVDYKRIVQILREARYSGAVALEYEAEEDPLTAIPGQLQALRGAIQGTS
jgi:sugar phosphate isomerase/epimerase